MVAWGKRVSRGFRELVIDIAIELETQADWLMTCIAFETGKSFKPDIKNMAGSGATGLIQFMPSTAKALGTSVDALSAMTAEQQLEYVRKYFAPYKGRLDTLEDVYMAILWPKAVGKPEDYILFDRGNMPTTYRQNAGLDLNRDGVVTKWEATAKVRSLYYRGLEPENATSEVFDARQ